MTFVDCLKRSSPASPCRKAEFQLNQLNDGIAVWGEISTSFTSERGRVWHAVQVMIGAPVHPFMVQVTPRDVSMRVAYTSHVAVLTTRI